MPRLFMALALARGDGRYAKLLRTIARVDLLVLDDWGPQQLNAEQRRDLLEIVEDRYDVHSIIITSQLPIERWYEVIGDPTLADAILDRIIHNAYRIELNGEGMRKLKAVSAESDARKPAKETPQDVETPASTPAKGRRK
jgi:DNA replication protein DnaC